MLNISEGLIIEIFYEKSVKVSGWKIQESEDPEMGPV